MATPYESRRIRALDEGEANLMKHYDFKGSHDEFFTHHDWQHDPVYWKLRNEALERYGILITVQK